MKNIYKYFDSVSEFGRLSEDRLKSRNFFYCYINNTFIDRVIRVTIEKEDDFFYIAKLFYKGSRSLYSKYRSTSIFGCCCKIYDSLTSD